jgi:C4-dicarboxylate-specific signal transduction histidine kinase
VPVLLGATSFDETANQGVSFVLDLTERKRAETEMRESEQRYRELQMELARANRVATMGQLSASLAHEVNQPIAAVIANANAGLRWLGARPQELEEVRQALARIVRDGKRAGEVIERVRALVKKAPPRRDRLDINEAVREVISLTQAETQRSRVGLRTWLGDDLPLVPGDRVQLQQVIVNLLVNALEAMSGASDGPRELTSPLVRTTQMTCSSKFRIPVRGSIRQTSTGCSNPSTRPNPTGWAWGSRSAARSSKHMAGACRQRRISLAAPSFG